MRDWKGTLLLASYNGVSFWVESEDRTVARRLAIHETAGGEVSVIEDMGAATGRVAVTAYLAGDAADLEANALLAVMSVSGPGMLILPIDGMMMAWPEDARRSRHKDQHGYVAVDLGFVLNSQAPGISIGIGTIGAAFSAGLSAAVSAFAGLF